MEASKVTVLVPRNATEAQLCGLSAELAIHHRECREALEEEELRVFLLLQKARKER